MKTYKNSITHFYAEIPDSWSINSWKHADISPKWKDLYQLADDDLPLPNESKFMFTANHMEDSIRSNCGIEASIYQLDPSQSFNDLMYSGNEKNIPQENIGGFVFFTKNQKLNDNDNVKFFWCRLKDNLWIYIKATCYGKQYEQELYSCLARIKRLDS